MKKIFSSLFIITLLISCSKKIKIGNDVQIGEYTSVRDSSHDYSELGVPMKYNPDISNEIKCKDVNDFDW